MCHGESTERWVVTNDRWSSKKHDSQNLDIIKLGKRVRSGKFGYVSIHFWLDPYYAYSCLTHIKIGWVGLTRIFCWSGTNYPYLISFLNFPKCFFIIFTNLKRILRNKSLKSPYLPISFVRIRKFRPNGSGYEALSQWIKQPDGTTKLR